MAGTKKNGTGWYKAVLEESPVETPPMQPLLNDLANAQNGLLCGGRRSTTEAEGATAVCPVCQEERVVMQAGEGKFQLRWWSECHCLRTNRERAVQAQLEAEQYAKRDAQERIAKQLGLFRVRDLKLDTFDPTLLHADTPGEHPHAIAKRWLETIRGASEGDYRSGPPPALYFYSKGKGRGKTHLAAGIAWQAYDWGYLAAFLEETSYLSRYWAEDFEERDSLQTLVGDRAWLTIIDDLGQTPPAKKGGESGSAKAWYDITNRRWLKRGWTIITSNHTLEDLEQQGTINEATYSRLYQMTRGQMVVFDGDDYRLGGA